MCENVCQILTFLQEWWGVHNLQFGLNVQNFSSMTSQIKAALQGSGQLGPRARAQFAKNLW